jgi:hypothetical protein
MSLRSGVLPLSVLSLIEEPLAELAEGTVPNQVFNETLGLSLTTLSALTLSTNFSNNHTSQRAENSRRVHLGLFFSLAYGPRCIQVHGLFPTPGVRSISGTRRTLFGPLPTSPRVTLQAR